MKKNHASDCAVHNEPAMLNKPCDCGLDVGFKMNELLRYLPYGTKVFDGEDILELGMPNSSQLIYCDFRHLLNPNPPVPYQLILYPKRLLLVTLKDTDTGEFYNPLKRMFGEPFSLVNEDSNQPFQNNVISFAKGVNGIESKFLPAWIVEKLIEWQFDVFDLFDDGLAVSIIDIES